MLNTTIVCCSLEMHFSWHHELWIETWILCCCCFRISPTSLFSIWHCLLEQSHEILTHFWLNSSDERQTWGCSGVHWWMFPGVGLSTEVCFRLYFPWIKAGKKIYPHRKPWQIRIVQSISSLIERTALLRIWLKFLPFLPILFCP